MPSRLRRWATAHQPVVVAYWDRAEVHYFVACRRGKSIRPLAAGSLVRVPETDPLEQLTSHLASSQLTCRRIVLLLSRSELELSTLNQGLGAQLKQDFNFVGSLCGHDQPHAKLNVGQHFSSGIDISK